jgi:Zn-dependent protease
MVEFSPYIGSIDGIEIQLHWSFLLLLLFILLVSAYYFVIWVLLFVCVLIHELTHSVTSRRNGVAVKKIILYPFGGGSVIDFNKVNPEIEFRISIVGPISSLLLAALFGVAAIYAPAGMIRYTLQLLFLLNIFLGVFNLLPWLPLDGGRALRSYLQERMSYYDATKAAVKVSNVISGLFIVGTIVYVALIPGTFTYKEFIVLWDVLLAMFIYTGARAEMQNAFVKENISSLRVGDAVSKSYVEVKGSTTIPQLYKTMLKYHTHVVLFRDGDAIKAVSNLSLDKMPWKGKAMASVKPLGVEVPQMRYGERLYGAMEKMQTYETGIVAVMRGNRLVGVLLAPHVESVVSLYLSHKKAMPDSAKR